MKVFHTISFQIMILMIGCKADDLTTRLMYDSMARLVGDTEYPESW